MSDDEYPTIILDNNEPQPVISRLANSNNYEPQPVISRSANSNRSQPVISHFANNYGESANMLRYQTLRELGRGKFGIVYLGYDLHSARYVTIKTIDIKGSEKLGVNIESINNEINALKELSKDGCNQYIQCYYDNFEYNLNGRSTIFIILEYVEGISLSTYIKENPGNLRPNILWPIILQLLQGLKFIHDKGYAHRDIKPDNVLITNDLRIKYIDFGLACSDTLCYNKCKNDRGTLLYMPPEFFNGTGLNSLQNSKAHDIWSLNMLLFELANGKYKLPFNIYASDGSTLSSDQVKINIANAPQFSSNYILDDGRTNYFLNRSIVSDWKNRYNIHQLIDIYLNNVLSIVYQY